MTRTKFYINRFTQLFGAFNRNKHLNAAASETQLYVDAQRFFGATIWRDAENLEAISAEYWTLRNLEAERDEMMNDLEKSQGTLAETQEIRQVTVAEWKSEIENLENQRKEAITKLGHMRSAVHQNRDQGKTVKKSYEGLKMQLKVIGSDPENEQAREAVNKRMTESRAKFEELKIENVELVTVQKKQEKFLHSLEERITDLRNTLKQRAMKTYSTIGQANQETSEVKAKMKRIDREISRLHIHVGRYVLNNSTTDPAAKLLAKKHKLLFAQIRLLEKSINYNHRLADLG